jgi:hypothetical protein
MVCVGCSMSCLLPQDDLLLTERPPAANRPVRLVTGSARPGQREALVRLGVNCPRAESEFSIRASDADVGDTIRANWFIDPNERYVAAPNRPVISGNPGTRIAGTDERIITSPSNLRITLQQFADGQRHRVEVVITDGEFIESEFVDPTTMEPRPALGVSRQPVRIATGEVIPVEAYRDDYVWFVEVNTAPCQ